MNRKHRGYRRSRPPQRKRNNSMRRRRAFVETLEDRRLLTVVTLLGDNPVPPPVTLNNAVFSVFNLKGSGTGNIQPFVRVQNNGTEQGYNTSGTIQFDTKTGTWT